MANGEVKHIARFTRSESGAGRQILTVTDQLDPDQLIELPDGSYWIVVRTLDGDELRQFTEQNPWHQDDPRPVHYYVIQKRAMEAG